MKYSKSWCLASKATVAMSPQLTYCRIEPWWGVLWSCCLWGTFLTRRQKKRRKLLTTQKAKKWCYKWVKRWKAKRRKPLGKIVHPFHLFNEAWSKAFNHHFLILIFSSSTSFSLVNALYFIVLAFSLIFCTYFLLYCGHSSDCVATPVRFPV